MTDSQPLPARLPAPIPAPLPAPLPAALSHLRASNRTGLAVTLATGVVTAAGATLSMTGGWAAWALGQLLLAAALIEWFVLLHECGHGTLFRSRRANAATGQLAGLMSVIPFDVWKHVHRQHHRWTGWQDLDPTTAALAPRQRSRAVTALVRTCWRCWVPLFAVAYRVTNFWNPSRMADGADRSASVRMAAGAIALAFVYGAVAWRLGWADTIRLFGAASVLAFVAEETLLLSQHTHVPMDVGADRSVRPHRPIEQERFTRSLRLPRAVSAWMLHFDAHELHHMYPFVPGYRLREIPYATANEVPWQRWLREARAIPGDVLLFQNRHQTGFDL